MWVFYVLTRGFLRSKELGTLQSRAVDELVLFIEYMNAVNFVFVS